MAEPKVNGDRRIAGLVLAGGRSSRFGTDKALALLAGRTLLDWSLAALDGLCETTAVSVASGGRPVSPAPGRTLVRDDPAHGEGPLAGVAAGLLWAAECGFEILVTLPCDTPEVATAHLERLIAALGEAPAAFAVSRDGPHPLCAAWRTSLAPDLAAALAGGDHPPARAFLRGIGAVPVAFDDPRPFANINRAADLRRRAKAPRETPQKRPGGLHRTVTKPR